MKKQTFRKWAPKTYNQKTRSVQALLATETPVQVFDFMSGGGAINEILLMSGVQLPESSQIPLLDTHDRFSVRSVIGSCRDLRVEGDGLAAELFFSEDEAGRDLESKIAGGHLTDLSIGAEILDYEEVPEGTEEVIAGRAFEGPKRVITSWRPFEASAVAVGADSNSIIRNKDMGTKSQNKDQQDKREPSGGVSGDDQTLRAERERVAEIYEMCSVAQLDEFAHRFITEGVSVEAARQKIFDHMKRTNPPIGAGRICVEETDGVKKADAVVDGLLIRSGFSPENPAPGAEDFQHASVLDVARECLHRNPRENVRMLSKAETIRRAMTYRTHSTDDFPNILANTGNKMLREAFTNAPSTFQDWTVKGRARDFKEMQRVQLSEAPDLLHIPENAEYTHGTFGEDSAEVFQVLKYGRIFTISWESLVNDDLDAFGRIAKAFVQAAKRGLNANVYQKLFDNANMSDGLPLFGTGHKNLETSDPGIIDISRLSSARSAMRKQTGLQTDYALNIEPRHLIVPASLETTADQVINTMVGLESSDGAGARNPFYQKLNVITEPLLDSNSTDAWYVVANPRKFDTIEVAYLDGNEAPYLEEDNSFDTDSWRFKIRFAYGICVLDHRGFYKNPGA